VGVRKSKPKIWSAKFIRIDYDTVESTGLTVRLDTLEELKESPREAKITFSSARDRCQPKPYDTTTERRVTKRELQAMRDLLSRVLREWPK
jgi:hypothetical protein